jgi:hypothetical protein
LDRTSKTALCNVSIKRGSREVAMTEGGLDERHVAGGLVEAGRERVPQAMDRIARAQLGPLNP